MKSVYSELLNIKLLPIKSDPTNSDGDGDGILDKVDYWDGINAAKEKAPQFFVPSGRTKYSETFFVYSQSLAIRDKYFYQRFAPVTSSNKTEYYVFNGKDYQSAKELTPDELLGFVCVDKVTYKKIYLKCFGKTEEMVIDEKYNEYYSKKQKYAKAVYEKLNPPAPE